MNASIRASLIPRLRRSRCVILGLFMSGPHQTRIASRQKSEGASDDFQMVRRVRVRTHVQHPSFRV
eukprot:3932683-Rhodomonas_salina.1